MEEALTTKNVQFTEEDIIAQNNLLGIFRELDINKIPDDIEGFSRVVLYRANLGKKNIRFEAMYEHGCCLSEISEAKYQVTDILFKTPDARPSEYQIKTILHELFHASADGLDVETDFNLNDNVWRSWEDTAAETAAHYMASLLDVNREMVPAYAQILIKTLPLLKQLPEFKECMSIADFGLKFLKYRFWEENRRVSWDNFSGKINIEDLNIPSYAKQYKEYAIKNKDEIITLLFESMSDINKHEYKDLILNKMSQSFDSGWENFQDCLGTAFSQSLIIIMNREGVKAI